MIITWYLQYKTPHLSSFERFPSLLHSFMCNKLYCMINLANIRQVHIKHQCIIFLTLKTFWTPKDSTWPTPKHQIKDLRTHVNDNENYEVHKLTLLFFSFLFCFFLISTAQHWAASRAICHANCCLKCFLTARCVITADSCSITVAF